MPDAYGNFKGQGWSQKRSDAWERVFGPKVKPAREPDDFELRVRGEITSEEYVRRLRARVAERRAAEFNPVGGASRGVGRCTCPCGRGTDPGCQVHP